MEEKKTIHLAIADDQVLFREGITHIINSFDNFKIDLSVNNGKQLLAKLNACKNQPDICMFEINMPEMNGYETLMSLKEKWPGLKVLILSCCDNEFAITKMLKGGANGYLLKSNNTFELNKALNSVYTHGSYYPDSFSLRLIGLLQNREPLPLLTDRELQFLSLCPTTLSYKDIARIMFVSPRTVDKFSKILFKKLNLNSRTSLAAFAFNIGLYTDANKKIDVL